jgi:hypothetical protein
VRQLVIENSRINSAVEEPGKHCGFTDDGITNEIVFARCPSAYFILRGTFIPTHAAVR